MTVLVQMDLPISRADIEEVGAALGSAENPPDGLLVHVVMETAIGVRVMDIWDTKDAFDKFNDLQLIPVMQKVMPEWGITTEGPPPERTFDEVFDVVRGR